MKVCSKCHIEKEESEFGKHKMCKGGIVPYCKTCEKECKKKYYENNKDKIIKKTIEYAKNNPDVRRKAIDNYYQKNKQQVIKNASNWNKEHIEERRNTSKKYSTKYRKLNSDKIKEYNEKNSRQIEKRGRDKMNGSYIKKLLKRSGYSMTQIMEVPILIDIKKIQIINHRVKKLQNKKS